MLSISTNSKIQILVFLYSHFLQSKIRGKSNRACPNHGNMGCNQSSARIAVEPMVEDRPQPVATSPVQTSPVLTTTKAAVQNGKNDRISNSPTATLPKQQQQPTTTNAMPWNNAQNNGNQNNQHNEVRKRKKKNNKIVVTTKATKNKPTNNNNKTLTKSPLDSVQPTSTETYSGNNDTMEHQGLVAPISSSASSGSNKIKFKPVKVKRRKRPRNESPASTAATVTTSMPALSQVSPGTEQSQLSVHTEASITSVNSIVTSDDVSPASPIVLDEITTITSAAVNTPTMNSPEPTPPPPSPPSPQSPLVDPARQKNPRPCPSLEKVGPTTLGVQNSLNDSRFSEDKIDNLTQRWGEVEFLLRIPIKNNNDIDIYHRTAYQSILLLQEIERMARDLGKLPMHC
jgi:hypothetical protein